MIFKKEIKFINFLKLCIIFKKRLLTYPAMSSIIVITVLLLKLNLIKFFKKNKNMLMISLSINKSNGRFLIKNILLLKKITLLKHRLAENSIKNIYLCNYNNKMQIKTNLLSNNSVLLAKIIV